MTRRARDLTAGDLMESHVLSVSQQAPLSTVHRLFADEGISAAPVVDEAEHIVGIVSTTDLVQAAAQEHATVRRDPDYFRRELEFAGPELTSTPEDYLERLGERTVEEVMSREVVRVAPDTSVSEVARTLRTQGIHRVLVVDAGKLVGIVSSLDLVRLLE